MDDFPIAAPFAARLPRLGRPVRVHSFRSALAFVSRWAIREKDPAVRYLQRRFRTAETRADAEAAVAELKALAQTRGRRD